MLWPTASAHGRGLTALRGSILAVPRLTLARSFRLALLGLTVTLAVLAAVGVAQLYQARQRYEDRTAEAYAVEAAAGNPLAAGAVEGAAIRTASGPTPAAQRRPPRPPVRPPAPPAQRP